MKLELIMPHYNEPWEVSEPFFTMLKLQRGIDFSDILVTVVQDGEEGALLLQEHEFPYPVRQIVIPHSGVSAARNKGIDSAVGDWICFCDCDDMFADIYSLKFVFDGLSDEANDLLWTPFYIESYNKEGKLIIRDNGRYNQIWTHCKFIRLSWLKAHPEIRFQEHLHYGEDSAFNAILNMDIDSDRIGMIRAPISVYTWTYREGSATTNPDNTLRNLWGQFERNKYVMKEFKKRGMLKEAHMMAGRTITDAYEQINRNNPPDGLEGLERAFTDFYEHNKLAFMTLSRDLLDRVASASAKEAKDCGYLNENKPSLTDWLNGLEAKYGSCRNMG